MGDSGRAVVIDTNFVRGKHFRADRLRSLASRLATRGHDVVIPEVVVWEWASHAHDALADGRASQRRLANAVDASLEVPIAVVPETSIDSIIATIERVVGEMDGVEIRATAGDDAVEALREQVTLTGLGERREGVKTGAVDAVVLRIAAACLSEYDEVVLATSDRALAEATEALGVTVVADQQQLWKWHGTTPIPPEGLAPLVAALVEGQASEALAGHAESRLLSEGVNIGSDIYEYAGFTTEDVRDAVIEFDSIDQVVVHEIEVVDDGPAPFAVAEVEVVGDATVANWYVGGNDGDLIDEWTTVGVSLTVSITVSLDANGEPADFEVNGTAAASVSLQ